MDNIIVQQAKQFIEQLSLVDTIKRATTKAITETINLVDTITNTKTYNRALTEVVTLVETIKTQAGKAFKETLTLVDNITNQISLGRLLQETITLKDRMQGLLNGLSIKFIGKYVQRAGNFIRKYLPFR